MYIVSIYDFVKNENEVLREFSTFSDAEEYAYSTALRDCEDEKPDKQIIKENCCWLFTTNSDFGILIKVG